MEAVQRKVCRADACSWVSSSVIIGNRRKEGGACWGVNAKSALDPIFESGCLNLPEGVEYCEVI